MDPMELFEEAEDALISGRSGRFEGRPTRGRVIMEMPALRAPARRAVDARPPRRSPRSRLGRHHRAARGQGAAARAGVLVLRTRSQASTLSGLPHGLIVLAGPPGTGKTTIPAGWRRWRRGRSAEGATTLVEIDPHAFPSEMLGESQRAVSRLFTETLPEMPLAVRTVVLVDEVESFAVRRTTASFETNPVDVHRATDAVLAGVDEIAESLPRCSSSRPPTSPGR